MISGIRIILGGCVVTGDIVQSGYRASDAREDIRLLKHVDRELHKEAGSCAVLGMSPVEQACSLSDMLYDRRACAP